MSEIWNVLDISLITSLSHLCAINYSILPVTSSQHIPTIISTKTVQDYYSRLVGSPSSYTSLYRNCYNICGQQLDHTRVCLLLCGTVICHVHVTKGSEGTKMVQVWLPRIFHHPRNRGRSWCWRVDYLLPSPNRTSTYLLILTRKITLNIIGSLAIWTLRTAQSV